MPYRFITFWFVPMTCFIAMGTAAMGRQSDECATCEKVVLSPTPELPAIPDSSSTVIVRLPLTYETLGCTESILTFWSFPGSVTSVLAAYGARHPGLRKSMLSDTDCEDKRRALLSGSQDTIELKLDHQVFTRKETQTQRVCRFHGGGGHAGGYQSCSDVITVNLVIYEEFRTRITGELFTSSVSLKYPVQR